ncbi:MAG: MFS transporter [Marinosulfonomonas sp.]
MSHSTAHRFEFIALVALLTSLTAFGLDAILPAMPAIGQELQVAVPTQLQLIVTMFTLGMVFGEVLFGPLCDAIGRKSAILLGIAIFCVGSVLAMTASSIEQVVLGRILQGIGVSGPKIGARTLVRDKFSGEAMAQVMSLVFTIFILVPMLAPAIGQGMTLLTGWRGLFGFYVAVAVLAGAWLALRQPETLPVERRIALAPGRILRNGARILRHPVVLAHSFAAGLIFGAQLLYLSTAHSLIAEVYGKGLWFPYYFAVLALGIGIASFINARLVLRFGMAFLVNAALIAMAGLSAAVLGIAWFYSGVPPFWVFMAMFFAIFFCLGILFGNLNAISMQALGAVAGLGSSMIASVSSLIAVVFSMSLGWFYTATILPVAFGFLAASVAAKLAVNASRRGDEYSVLPAR